MNEIFQRVATRRAANAVKSIMMLQNCFSKSYYDYTEAEAQGLLEDLKKAISHLDSTIQTRAYLVAMRDRSVKKEAVKPSNTHTPVPIEAPKGLFKPGQADSGELDIEKGGLRVDDK